MSRNIYGCGCSPRATRTSAASATTTSRSTAGAAPRWTTSCASRSDFPGATVIRLERNYRSTPHILGAASGLIAKNEGRLGKTLAHRNRRRRDRSSCAAHWDGDEEARAIGDDIENLQRKGERLDDMAILVRASFQMRAFEDRFITLGLPYRVDRRPALL